MAWIKSKDNSKLVGNGDHGPYHSPQWKAQSRKANLAVLLVDPHVLGFFSTGLIFFF